MAKSNLKERFQKKANYLNRVLRTLGREERIRKPEKLTSRYVQSLESIGKRKLEAYFDGELSKRDSNVISNRLTEGESLNFNRTVKSTKQPYNEDNIKLYETFEEPTPDDFVPDPMPPEIETKLIQQEFWEHTGSTNDIPRGSSAEPFEYKQQKIDVVFNEEFLTIIDVSTGEILEDLHNTGMETIDEIHPSHRRQFFDEYYSKYNILNIDDLTEDTYYSYIDSTRDRIDEIINLDTRGAEIFRSMVNGWYSAYGEENTLRAINSLEGEFWETVDRVSEYPENGEVGTAAEGKELGLNIQKLQHLVSDALLNTQFKYNA